MRALRFLSIAEGFYEKPSRNWVRDGSAVLFRHILEGSGDDIADAIALDLLGNIHLTGWTQSANSPTLRPFQAANAGGDDAFITKINLLSYGSLTHSGESSNDDGMGIALDPSGDATIAGTTTSTNLPVLRAFQRTKAGAYDAFVAKWAENRATLTYSAISAGAETRTTQSIATSGSKRFRSPGSRPRRISQRCAPCNARSAADSIRTSPGYPRRKAMEMTTTTGTTGITKIAITTEN